MFPDGNRSGRDDAKADLKFRLQGNGLKGRFRAAGPGWGAGGAPSGGAAEGAAGRAG